MTTTVRYRFHRQPPQPHNEPDKQKHQQEQSVSRPQLELSSLRHEDSNEDFPLLQMFSSLEEDRTNTSLSSADEDDGYASSTSGRSNSSSSSSSSSEVRLHQLKRIQKSAPVPVTAVEEQTQQRQQEKKDPQEVEPMTKQSGSIWHWLRLPFCAAGICVSFLCCGILEEMLFNSQRLGASFVLVSSCLTNTVVALVWKAIQERVAAGPTSTPSSSLSSLAVMKTTLPPLHHKLFFLTAGCFVGTMECCNQAIPRVSYPFVVLAKSCKLLPIMLVGQWVEGKRYATTEWMAACFISMGVVLFQFSRMAAAKNSSTAPDTAEVHDWWGMALLVLSLILDGFLGSCQSLLKRPSEALSSSKTRLPHHRVPNAVETMLYVNLYALLFLVPFTCCTGQMQDGWNHILQSIHTSHCEAMSMGDNLNNVNSNLGFRLFILNIASGCGQVFVFLTLTWYSPVMTTTITTTRKFFTILLSVQTFGHGFSNRHWISVAMVFTGLVILAHHKNSTSTATTTNPPQPSPPHTPELPGSPQEDGMSPKDDSDGMSTKDVSELRGTPHSYRAT